jgi:hypothetical protein
MAFNPANLVFWQQPGPPVLQDNAVIWLYTTTDSLSDVETKPNRGGTDSFGIYFESAGGHSTALRLHDLIAVTASDGNALYQVAFVSSTLHTGDDNNGNFEINRWAKGSSVTGFFWNT